MPREQLFIQNGARVNRKYNPLMRMVGTFRGQKQNRDWTLPAATLLIEAGANLETDRKDISFPPLIITMVNSRANCKIACSEIYKFLRLRKSNEVSNGIRAHIMKLVWDSRFDQCWDRPKSLSRRAVEWMAAVNWQNPIGLGFVIFFSLDVGSWAHHELSVRLATVKTN